MKHSESIVLGVMVTDLSIINGALMATHHPRALRICRFPVQKIS